MEPGDGPPAKIAHSDANSVSLGVKFPRDVSGAASGIRSRKGPTNAGNPAASL